MLKIIYTLLILTLVSSLTVEQLTQKGILQIQPTALDSMRYYFDKQIVFVQGDNNSQYINQFVQEVSKLNETIKNTNVLFGIIDLKDDVTGKLKENSDFQPGIKIITERNIYSMDSERVGKLGEFYQEVTRPELKTIQQITEIPADEHILIFSYPNASSYRGFLDMYHILKEDLEQFSVKCVGKQSQNLSITLRLSSGQSIEYQSDPADLLEVVKFVNTETIPLVSNLSDDKTLHRVFGAGIQTQLIMMINQTIPQHQLQTIINTLQEVAKYNKHQQLKYQRIIFTVAPTTYAHHLMADLIEDLKDSKFKIILTRTNYNAFALQRFLFTEEELTVDALKQFIDDFRLKKLKPFYRSEPKPGDQDREDIIKIVGKTFNEKVYKNKDNVMVFFYDSKDPYSFRDWKKVLNEFVKRYKEYYQGELIIGQFDLALNEHENLYLKYAPQLHIFSKKSKKQAFRFQGELTLQTLKQFVKNGVKEISIPDNVGEPMALGRVSQSYIESLEL